MRMPRNIRRVFCALLLLHLASAAPAAAQSVPTLQEAKAWLSKELRYLNLDTKVNDAELTRLAELRVQSQNIAEKDQAIAAYKEMWSKIIALYGNTGFPANRLEQNLQFMATRTVNAGPPAGEPWPAGHTPAGELGKVVKRGRGPVPMILIPPIGFDESVYESFMTRNAERYTMYVATPAGFGNTLPPPRPERLDLEKLPWWSGYEQGVLKLIAKEKLKKPVVVGMVAGAYSAAHLALQHPEQFRAAILLNGMLVSPMGSPADPSKAASLEERRRMAYVRFNMGLTLTLSGVTPRRTSVPMLESALKNAPPQQRQFMTGMNTRDEVRGTELFRTMSMQTHPEANYGYTVELMATDLTESFLTLKVPLLAIPSMSDDLWTASGVSRTNYIQFAEMKERHPEIPLTIAPFYDTRMLPTEDSPAELDATIADFLAGRPVAGKTKEIFAPQASPRATTREGFGSGFVEVRYARPAVKGRKLWGELVPHDKVWRAGANEATTITLPEDALVQGEKLAKGTYTFFAIPGKDEWTLVFNRVLHQWGAFNYNSEFDALRVKAKPRGAAMQEWLQYTLEPAAENSIELRLIWGELEVPLRIAQVAGEAKKPM